MADPRTTSLTAPQAGDGVNNDEESRLLLGFLQNQCDAVLKIVEELPEEAWQTRVLPSGWTVAGMLKHIGGAEHHWFQNVAAGGTADKAEVEVGEYDPYAAFKCDWPAADARRLESQRPRCSRPRQARFPNRYS